MREKILFDDGWKFHLGDIPVPDPVEKGPVYMQAKTERKRIGPASVHYVADSDDYSTERELNPVRWESVTLPHDYVVGQTPDKRYNNALGFFKYENAWYRKTFTVSKSDRDKRICLYFDGVAVQATVYFNGCLMGHNFSGYTGFEIDITDYVEFDCENVLAVYVDATSSHEGWWYEGGGIYRHVWLVKTDKVSVDLFGLYVRPEYKGDRWDLSVTNTVRNDRAETVGATVKTEILDGNRAILTLSGECELAPMSKGEIAFSGEIKSPRLWSVDDPYQYRAVTKVYRDGALCDACESRFGFRYFAWSPETGFTVNGKKTFLNGVCAHEDFGLTGKAVADNIRKYKIGLIKEMGANAYRCTHYPQTAETMDALDEAGLIVMAETRWFESTKEGLEQLETLIKRDRNRPSVFFWSVGNEEPKQTTDAGRRISRRMIEKIRQLDPTRWITCAVSNDPDKATVYDDLDVIGINYNHWNYDAVHKNHPDKMIVASECCATGTTRGWYYDDDPQKGYFNAVDHDTNEWFIGRENTWRLFRDRPYISGAFQWIAFEHRGECTWPRVCSQSGAIDLFMQKKDAFYQNQTLFISDRPLIHVLPHWNREGEEGEPIRVVAYTNCEEAELFVNGKSFGKVKIDRPGHAEWSVPYVPGTIKAVGYNGGTPVAGDACRTTKNPVGLALKLENEIEKANGRDVALVTCTCVDEDGLEVPDANPFVRFTPNRLGRIVGTGSDVSDHVPVTCPDRKMRAGRIAVAVAIGEVAGTFTLRAEADGLTPAVLKITLK